MNDKKKQKFSGIHLLLRTLKHVIKGDKEYIKKVSEFKGNSDYLEICHNGTEDYGKIIYVIKENTGYDGFCATMIFVLYYLIFAEQHGLAPVIRLSKEFAYFDEEMSKEIANPWEYYFVVQGNEYDENKALNVSYCNYLQRDKIREKYGFADYSADRYYDESLFDIYSPIIRKYLVLKPEIINESENLLKPVTEIGGKVLGVHFRGTDYKKGYNGHPVFVTEEQTIEEIRKAMDSGMFRAVFIATDDADICDRIKEAGVCSEVIYHSDVFRSKGNESVAFSENSRKNHRYLLGYEIARDMYTLSLCEGLVAGKSRVSLLSNLYKHSRGEEYGYMYIVDNGNNSNDNEYY